LQTFADTFNPMLCHRPAKIGIAQMPVWSKRAWSFDTATL